MKLRQCVQCRTGRCRSEESDFYAFRLNQDEVIDTLPQERQVLHSSNKQGKLKDVKAGDLAILHVVTS